jgi:hypothetical protein
VCSYTFGQVGWDERRKHNPANEAIEEPIPPRRSLGGHALDLDE